MKDLHFRTFSRYAVVILLGLLYQSVLGIDISTGGTPQQLWDAFNIEGIPSGVTNLRVSTSTPFAPQGGLWGRYGNAPEFRRVSLKDGVVLATGEAQYVAGWDGARYLPYRPQLTSPLQASGGGGINGHGYLGDADVAGAVGVGQDQTFDASSLIVEFTTDETVEGFSFYFLFGTEEYPEFLGSQYNDAFIALHNGENIALDNNGRHICLNNDFMILDNQTQRMSGGGLFDWEPHDNATDTLDIEWNGMTLVLKASAPLSPGNHRIKFAVADVGDSRVDAGVLLSDFKFEYDDDDDDIIPIVPIVADTTFEVSEQTPGGTVTDYIENLSRDVQSGTDGASLQVLSGEPDFTVQGNNWSEESDWHLAVSPGVDLDYDRKNEYEITVEGRLNFLGSAIRDTAVITILITEDKSLFPLPELDSAVMYDRTGDGRGDSVSLHFASEIPEGYGLGNITFSWPAGEIDYLLPGGGVSDGTQNTIARSFTPGADAPVWTEGESVINMDFDSLGMSTLERGGVVQESIGALLTEAIAYIRTEPGNDTLEVGFTEPVNVLSIRGPSFTLIQENGDRHSLTPLEELVDLGEKRAARFIIDDMGNDAPAEGDSLQILHSGNLRDERDIPSHEENTPVPIEFVDMGASIEITDAVYYDRSGDGHPDEIDISLRGRNYDQYYEDIYSALHLPEYRSLKKTSWDGGENKLTLHVEEGMSPPATFVNGRDILEVPDTVFLDDGYMILPVSVPIQDSMAPVILSASYTDSLREGSVDLLTVEFSEDIISPDDIRPFLYYKQGSNTEFSGELSLLEGSQTTWEFVVESLDNGQTIVHEDSIRIFHDASPAIGDDLGNEQKNSENRKVPIDVTVIPDGIGLSSVRFYDDDADGYLDRIEIDFSEDVGDFSPEDILSVLEFENTRDMTIDNASARIDGLSLSVSDERENISTALPSGASAVITDSVRIAEDIVVVPSQVPIEDSMAPVALWGHFTRHIASDEEDILKVSFSEDIGSVSDHEHSLLFYTPGLESYTVFLADGRISGSQGEWRVSEITGRESIMSDDSLRINAGIADPVGDVNSIVQNNRENRRAPITVEIVATDIAVEEAYWYDMSADGRCDRVVLRMNSTVDERWLAPMSSVLSFEGARNLEISGELQGHDREIIIPVTETSEGPLETGLSADEAVSVSSDLLIDDRWILSAGVTPAQDAMAPVISEAVCTDTLRLYIRGITEEEEYVEGQTFTVDFSEDLERQREEYPLLFIQDDDVFTPSLEL
ncbi:MAG: choice-of-anchor L domain-containing protein, partial [Fibrobacterota bacterium]